MSKHLTEILNRSIQEQMIKTLSRKQNLLHTLVIVLKELGFTDEEVTDILDKVK